MKKPFVKGETVLVKKKYQNKVCILPGTKMLVAELKRGGNVRTIWADKSMTPYSADFFDFMLKRSKECYEVAKRNKPNQSTQE